MAQLGFMPELIEDTANRDIRFTYKRPEPQPPQQGAPPPGGMPPGGMPPGGMPPGGMPMMPPGGMPPGGYAYDARKRATDASTTRLNKLCRLRNPGGQGVGLRKPWASRSTATRKYGKWCAIYKCSTAWATTFNATKH